MERVQVEADIRETLGLVLSMFDQIPDQLIEQEWSIMKTLELGETHIPNKYKDLIGVAISGATRCRYCAYFHAEAARLFGATEEEIVEAGLIAKHVMGWSSYLNSIQLDYNTFVAEVDQAVQYVRSQAPVPA